MPDKYEKIRDAYLRKGIAEKLAKKYAAMTYNSQRKPGQKPVTGKDKKEK